MSDATGAEQPEVRVVVPSEPPLLTAGAARVLLRIIRDAAARAGHEVDLGGESDPIWDDVERKAA